jgi:hypothetical protein
MEERRWKKFSIDHKLATEFLSLSLTIPRTLVLALRLVHFCLSCCYGSFFIETLVTPAPSHGRCIDRYGLRLSRLQPQP